MPLTGDCRECGGRVNLTVHKGSVNKYMQTAIQVADEYDCRPYTKQRLEVLERRPSRASSRMTKISRAGSRISCNEIFLCGRAYGAPSAKFRLKSTPPSSPFADSRFHRSSIRGA